MSKADLLVEKILPKVWEKEIINKNPLATPSNKYPQGFVLGGQPGAGKSRLLKEAANRLKDNIIAINGDDFRKYHPDYASIQKEHEQEAARHTAEFAGAMTEAVLQKALAEKYNIVIEGTFRTANTPIKTLQSLKDSGYETTVLVQTCKQEVSWASCLERYEKMLEVNPKEARFTPKEHHDTVVASLSKNIKEVAQTGLADHMQVFARVETRGKEGHFEQQEIYNNATKKVPNSATIDKYILGERHKRQEASSYMGR